MNSDLPQNGLTVITTHINADFDALASMLAAQKLYPDAVVVFPGSQEKNLRNFFIKSMVYLFNMADIRHIDFSAIRRLILVDTRQANRIGALSSLLDNPDVEIHVYDHHPPMGNDIRGNLEIVEPTGATVTILTELIQKKGLSLAPDEATILCLGIYEDTGSFTFPSTTERDFLAAAHLVSRGANLNIVSSLIVREISPDQVSLLNEMLQAATRYNINGIEVMVTTVTRDNYVPDFAFLVHKMVKMEEISAIFAIAGMGSKIYIVARSNIPEVDVGEILGPLGGGGHTFAAAATVKERTLAQTEQKLIGLLYSTIQSRRQAKDLMSSPAITVDANVSCREANNLLTRYNINALLVTESPQDTGKERIAGFISRQVIEKALFHGLEDVAVREYMTTELATTGPDAGIWEIQEKIIDNKQRILPVVDGERITGVITRTDLLNILVHQSRSMRDRSSELREDQLHVRTRHIVKFMKERLPGRIMEVLRSIGQAAEDLGAHAYVVGGFVRDLFLYRPDEDLDIVIEGDGIAFAKKFAAMGNARIHSHEKFGTAVIIFEDGFKIDVASARMEYYKFPAALPTVEMSSIKLDMFRRDFTVNTLAIRLNPDRFGTLIDFFSGLKDIKEKAIRVLHNLSFVEDPTRVFRAIRFEQRFGFSIGKLTSGLIENAVKMDFFKRLSGRRVFSELRLILQEENPTPAIVRLHDFDLLKVVHPSISLDDGLIALLNAVTKVLDWHDLLFLEDPYMKWSVYFLAVIRNCDPKIAGEVCTRLELPPRLHKIFIRERSEAEECLFWLKAHLPVENSVLYERLSGFRTELILYMMAITGQETIKRAISHYFTQLRRVMPSVSGKDLQKMGFPPGPIYREILQAVHHARLNGRLRSKNDELAFIRRYVEERGQRSEVRGQRSEVRDQRSEVRGQTTEDQ